MRQLTRFFRFLLRLQGAVVVSGRFCTKERFVEIEVRRRKNAQPKCGTCKRPMTGEITTTQGRWRHLNMMFGIPTYITAPVREGRCSVHGRRHERLPWAAPRAKYTRPFDEQVARLVQVADRTAATRMFGIVWRTVGRMVKRVVGLHLPKDRFKGVRAIAVDETSYKRGHRYLTVVTCLDSSRVLWVEEGKSAETLHKFFDELGSRRAANIEVVAMDMSQAYQSVVRERAPQADIVFDRFHIVKLMLDAIDEIRREEVRNAPADQKRALKKTRFALLRNPRHWTPKDHIAIARIVKANRRLARAWQRRFDFEFLWQMPDEDTARDFLRRWTRSALLSRLEPLRKLAKTIRRNIDGILGFFRHNGLTSGPIEGMNNKIKLAIHRAFGFRSTSALISMIHLCCSGIDLN